MMHEIIEEKAREDNLPVIGVAAGCSSSGNKHKAILGLNSLLTSEPNCSIDL